MRSENDAFSLIIETQENAPGLLEKHGPNFRKLIDQSLSSIVYSDSLPESWTDDGDEIRLASNKVSSVRDYLNEYYYKGKDANEHLALWLFCARTYRAGNCAEVALDAFFHAYALGIRTTVMCASIDVEEENSASHVFLVMEDDKKLAHVVDLFCWKVYPYSKLEGNLKLYIPGKGYVPYYKSLHQCVPFKPMEGISPEKVLSIYKENEAGWLEDISGRRRFNKYLNVRPSPKLSQSYSLPSKEPTFGSSFLPPLVPSSQPSVSLPPLPSFESPVLPPLTPFSLPSLEPEQRIWKKDEASENCECCAQAFSFTKRRHHCRSCGNLICSDCSRNTNKSLALFSLFKDGKKFVPDPHTNRVCKTCHASL